MNELQRQRVQWWGKLLLGVAALVVLSILIDPEKIFVALLSAMSPVFALALFFAVPNIYVQYLKWRYLVHLQKPGIPDKIILESLFTGFAAGIVTPARIGEFGGRLIPDKRLQNGQTMSLIGIDKLSAMIVTVSVGGIGLAFWGHHFQWFGILPMSTMLGLSVCIPFAAWFVLRFVQASTPTKGTSLERVRKSFMQLAEGLRLLSFRDFIKMLGFSSLFYAIFVTQFVLLLTAFGNIDWYFAGIGVACVMVAKTIVPPVTLGELGIREGFSVFFLTMIGVSSASAFGASLLLFAINILLPSAIGAIILLRSSLQSSLPE